MRRFPLVRDVVMLVVGALAFTYETLSGGDRPNVIYGSLALMGVAAYLRGASIAARNGNGDKSKVAA